MSDKTNEEKLKILQERLAHIKGKKEDSANLKESEEERNLPTDDAADVIGELSKDKSRKYSRPIKYLITLVIVGFLAIYTIENIDVKRLSEDKENVITEDKQDIVYDLKLKGHNIVIIATFIEEESAKKMKENLKIKGFKADYFYLPNKSNSTEEVYKVFIGPYENKEESNQWEDNIKEESEIILL
tara:strand:- start:1766 stop:2323 length:558 start_codon:yes stop_codon:yes gene_type:complete